MGKKTPPKASLTRISVHFIFDRGRSFQVRGFDNNKVTRSDSEVIVGKLNSKKLDSTSES